MSKLNVRWPFDLPSNGHLVVQRQKDQIQHFVNGVTLELWQARSALVRALGKRAALQKVTP